MNVIRKVVAALGAIFLLALLLAALAPKATHAVAAALVQVTNTAANPVPNKDVDEPARHPFSASCTGDFATALSFSATCNIPVPAGEEVVLQSESFSSTTQPSGCCGPITQVLNILTTTSGGTAAQMQAVSNQNTTNGSGAPEHDAAYTWTLYADPGTDIGCTGFLGANTSDGGHTTCYVNGYYVTLP